MERRNFLKFLPLGILTLGAKAKGDEQVPDEIVKTEQLLVNTDDGEYAVLAVKKNSQQYRGVSRTPSKFPIIFKDTISD